MPVKSNHHWHVFAAESGNICQTVRVLWSICCRWSSFASKAVLYSFWRKGLDWMWLDEDECRYLSFTLCWFRFFVPVGHCNDLCLLGCFLLWIAWIIPPMFGLMVVIHGSEGSSPLHTCFVEFHRPPWKRHGRHLWIQSCPVVIHLPFNQSQRLMTLRNWTHTIFRELLRYLISQRSTRLSLERLQRLMTLSRLSRSSKLMTLSQSRRWQRSQRFHCLGDGIVCQFQSLKTPGCMRLGFLKTSDVAVYLQTQCCSFLELCWATEMKRKSMHQWPRTSMKSNGITS